LITDQLTAAIREAVLAARDAGDFTLADETLAIKLEMPPNKQFGDYSTNIALTLKRATGIQDSRIIAAAIQRQLTQASSLIDRVEIAGPGFLNFFLKPTWLHDVLVRIEAEESHYGTTNARSGERVLVEFVSANPTGPVNVVNGRAAVLGDVLANLLASRGCHIAREYYINDAVQSLQLERFAETVMIRYLQQLGHPVQMPDGAIEAGFDGDGASSGRCPVTFPPDGYRGEYVRDIAREIVAEVGDTYHTALERRYCRPLEGAADEITTEDLARDTFFRKATLHRMVDAQRSALEAFGVYYDRWFYESSLYESGAVDRVIQTLTERGYTYQRDGAQWLRSTAFGDSEDRVLIRSNEKATYIAADAAYHADKFERGFTLLIDIFGADHHGYVARLKASLAALGFDLTRIDVILTQMVSLMRDGEAVIGGKRKGNVIELKEDLIDDIGKDAARFYFLLNSYETPATVDVELAKRQSNDNPVYYVQYAHARLCNILRRASEIGVELLPATAVDRALLTHPKELDVLRKLFDYQEELQIATARYAPHRLTRYAIELASMLNLFYENCRVLSSKDEPIPVPLMQARLSLVNSARIVLHLLFDLIGISAPERMERADNPNS
jgi:arginyl-tRNA synthetase